MPLLRRWRSRKPNRSSAPIPACSRGMRTLLAMCSSSDVGSGECACRVSVGRSSRSLGGKAILPLCVSEIGMRFMKCMGISCLRQSCCVRRMLSWCLLPFRLFGRRRGQAHAPPHVEKWVLSRGAVIGPQLRMTWVQLGDREQGPWFLHETIQQSLSLQLTSAHLSLGRSYIGLR